MAKKDDVLAGTPEFFEKLAHAHYTRLARCVVLTGNIYDLFPITKDGETRFVALDELLESAFHNAKYPEHQVGEKFTVVNVKSDGVHLVSEDDPMSEFLQRIKDEFKDKNSSALLNIQIVSSLLNRIADVRGKYSESDTYVRPVCVIIDHAETIFPNIEQGRNERTTEAWKWFSDLIRKESLWADEETAAQRTDLIILLSPTISEISPKVLSLPKTELIEIPLPQSSHGILPKDLEDDARGLTLRAMNDLAIASRRDPQNSPLTREAIVAEITKRLQLELKDTVKLIRPEHTMADLVGSSKIIPRLRHLARRIDNPKRAPVGMVVTGPNGAGKTFRIEAWAAEMGRTVVTIAGDMKSKMYGETGRFLENFEMILSVYGRTCVIVDEAHKAFASIHDPDTYQADAEYARHIIQMMSNPKYRSKIFWVLITTRPDLLDPDIVRGGRCSLFVPICDPEGEDAEDFFSWMVRNFDEEGIDLDEVASNLLREKSVKENYEFSAGDYRRFIDDLIYEKEYCEEILKIEFNIKQFIADWKPSALRLGKKRRLHMLLAAKDADWRELLPDQLREMSEDEIEEEISALKLLNVLD